MSDQDNGGPAFPEVVTDITGDRGDYAYDVHSTGGMTLRDYFAAKAMQGRCAGIGRIPDNVVWNVDTVADQAYSIADAMLKARAK